MYMTRMQINPARRNARKLLGSPHAMHAAVRAAFAHADDYERNGTRTLWRLDIPVPGNVYLYVVSPGRPDLMHIVEQAGWPTTETWVTRDYDTLLETLAPGQRWAFRLTANPTHSGRKTPDSKETQRFALLREEDQASWLINRAGRCGFSIAAQSDNRPNLVLHQRRTQTFTRGMASVTLASVTYDGVLEIVDEHDFRRMLTSGMGHGRAYGCGLLTLAAPTGP